MVSEFDVWSSDDGRIKSTIASKPFVDDSDAPYSFSRHEIRVIATNRKEAVNQFRLANKRL